MLRALLKRENEIEPLDEPAAPSPNPCPKPRAKSFPIAYLYPEPELEPHAQAEMLLSEIQTHAADVVGLYVPASHLERFYGELCEREGWEPRHWCVVGRELSKLTERVCKKLRGKRFMAYEIPRLRT